MEFWNNIYLNLDPVAIKIWHFSIHWYGLMYVLALLSALWVAKWFLKKDKMPFSEKLVDSYFIWIEIGVILGARLGYIIFYDQNTMYYLANPWQIFNPFANGVFVGIRGMSFHGALLGFLVATFLFSRKYKEVNTWALLDLVALSVPLGYIFGRFGNFLNQELVGRATELPWGIYVAGILRHPSQIYEAVLEGLVVFVILFFYRKYKKFDGELIALYGILYSLARFIAEFWRQPDFQLGFVFGDFLTMGQILSILLAIVGVILYIFLKKRQTKLII